jgi:hypothetical protein
MLPIHQVCKGETGAVELFIQPNAEVMRHHLRRQAGLKAGEVSFPKTRNAHRSTRLEYPLSRRSPLIMVMETTDFGHRDHLAILRRMDRARFWTIHRQR